MISFRFHIALASIFRYLLICILHPQVLHSLELLSYYWFIFLFFLHSNLKYFCWSCSCQYCACWSIVRQRCRALFYVSGFFFLGLVFIFQSIRIDSPLKLFICLHYKSVQIEPNNLPGLFQNSSRCGFQSAPHQQFRRIARMWDSLFYIYWCKKHERHFSFALII